MKEYRLEKYVLFNGLTGEMKEFSLIHTWETQRKSAIKYALEMRDEGPELEPYKGIELSLEILYNGEDETRAFKILTGSKMHTEDILTALETERVIIEGAGFEVETQPTRFKEKTYLPIEHHFMKLYYFTETKP
jgi:hypothetical protein